MNQQSTQVEELPQATKIYTDQTNQLMGDFLKKIADDQIVDTLELFKRKDDKLAILLQYRWKRIEHDRIHGLISRDVANSEMDDLVYGMLRSS